MNQPDSNKLVFHELTFKNFLSFGNTPTTINLEGNDITVILGENIDTGGEESRNGAGKSSIIDALCYVLFGKVLRNITNPKLVNKLARKGQSMLVQITFTKGKSTFLVERGEEPSVMKLWEKPVDCEEDFHTKKGKTYKYNKSKGKTPDTNRIIELLGFDITLFEYLVVNSSENTPYFNLKGEEPRKVIESLFGFTLLTQRAKTLKEQRTEHNKKLIAEESSVNATLQANERIKRQIEDMKEKSRAWQRQHEESLAELKETIQIMEEADTEADITVLKEIDELKDLLKDTQQELSTLRNDLKINNKSLSDYETEKSRCERDFESLEEDRKKLEESICPTCNQHWEPDPEYKTNLKEKQAELVKRIEEIEKAHDGQQTVIVDIEASLSESEEIENDIKTGLKELAEEELTYDNIEEATKASTTLSMLKDQLKEEETEANPHIDSIENLSKDAVKEVNFDGVESLKSLISHYGFLIDLLTKKDSYVRKLIMEKSLPKLNSRIAHYLHKLELPFKVRFNSDLSLNITKFQQEYDYGNLSKGERQRLIISLNFAFQDVFEYMNYSINMLFVDELIDTAICDRGAENTLNTLTETADMKKKKVFLVTHKQNIADRIDDVMIVRKENDLSKIERRG